MSASTFTDSRDGKAYRTIKIGQKVWFAENLNFAEEGSRCYDNDPANGDKYGRLYDWETAVKACPPGWRLPTDEEWSAVEHIVGGRSIAGKKLKSPSGWNKGINETNEYGFSALPSGGGYGDGEFYGCGFNGFWWTGTEYGTGLAWFRVMGYDYDGMGRGYYGKTGLFAVRCIQK